MAMVPAVTVCRFFSRFAFKLSIRQVSILASEAVFRCFGHFFEEMRLNRMYADTEKVTIRICENNKSECQLHLAKQPYFPAFFGNFDVGNR